MSLYKLADIRHDLEAFRRDGLPTGNCTGWDVLSELYRPEAGYMTIVTGIPGHGKSEFIDALMVNMAHAHGWQFAVFSPENYPISFHFNKLVEKVCGNSHGFCPKDIYQEGTEFVDEHFTFVYPPEDKTTIGDILSQVKIVKENFGCNGFVLDPYNEIDHKRPEYMTETEYVSRLLSTVRRFCREEKLHGWIIAHPAKLAKDRDGKYPVPTPYDISGSAHWRNKADYCLCIHRPSVTENSLEVHVQKVKFKHFGKPGMVEFDYDWRSGRMTNKGNKLFTLPRRVE